MKPSPSGNCQEMNAMSVRRAVYQSVIAMDLVWFDLHLGAGEQ